MELIILVAIQHSIYFQDVRIRIGTGKFVARPVKTEDELSFMPMCLWLCYHNRIHRGPLSIYLLWR